MIKVATVCSGIGSPEQAIKNLNIPHEVVFACEIDKYAQQTYLANHDAKFMYSDMTKENWDNKTQYSDLFIGGIPCQAFSLAGKRLGELDKRGLLFYDFYRYVKNQQPKVFIIENVKGLLSDAGGKTFQNWLQLLGRSVNTQENMFNHPDSLEYNIHHTVLNSKNFGVPQNRERVFIVGIRKDLPNNFRFTIGFRLNKRLKDVLENDVDERYYLSEKMLSYFNERADNFNNGKINYKNGEDVASCITSSCKSLDISDNNIIDGEVTTNSQGGKVYGISGVSPTLSAGTHGYAQGYIKIKEATNKGFDIAIAGDSINLSNPNSTTRRGRVGKQIANTLDTSCNQAVVCAMRGRGSENKQQLEFRNDEVTNTITSVQKDNLILVHTLSGGKWDKCHESNRRVYSSEGISKTVTTMQCGNQEPKTIINNRIRRLTPLECFRLQGFPDSFIKPCSDTQLYKQAGNSITVNVMEAIIKNILPILS